MTPHISHFNTYPHYQTCMHTKTCPLCCFPVLLECPRPLTVFEPWPCHIRMGPRGKRGDSRGFDFTWRRSCKARSADKSPSCGGCLWVRVGHGSPSHPNPPSVSCLLLFLSSIHLSFQKRGRSEGNNGLVLPPLSSRQWGCIQNRGHGEPKGILLLLILFSSSQCFHLPLPILTLHPQPHPPSH